MSSPPTKIIKSTAETRVPSPPPVENVEEQAKETGDDREQQIQQVEQKIQQVEQEIQQVKDQITQVEKKLDLSLNDWERDQDLQAGYDDVKECRKWLRSEKEGLRSEKGYLL